LFNLCNKFTIINTFCLDKLNISRYNEKYKKEKRMKIEEVVKLQKRNPDYYGEIKILNRLIDEEQPMPSENDLKTAIEFIKLSYKELALLREEKGKK
tara:strand:+ start:670 stop:960 length:291 start_codon:yes stop_codon:yes gene_type:complete